MFKQRLVPHVLAWGISLLTVSLLIYLSWLWPGTLEIFYNGVWHTQHYNTLDAPPAIVTSLACIALIAAFRTYAPKIAYGGLQVYVWLAGFAFCYIQSGSIRSEWYSMQLPHGGIFATGMVLSLIVSCLVWLFHKPVITFLSHILGENSPKLPRNEHEHFQELYPEEMPGQW